MLEDFREFDRTRLDLEDGSGSHDQALLNERATLHRTTGQVKLQSSFDMSMLVNLSCEENSTTSMLLDLSFRI